MQIPTINKTPDINFKVLIFLTKPIIAVIAEIMKINNKINVNNILYILSQLIHRKNLLRKGDVVNHSAPRDGLFDTMLWK
jgi:hypothetical protein